MQYRTLYVIVVLALSFVPQVAIAESLQGDCSAMSKVGGNFAPSCHNTYLARPARDLASPVAQKFVQHLLNLPRDQAILVTSPLGDKEAQSLANQVQAFLQRSGFKIAPNSPSLVVWPTQLKGIRFDQPSDPQQPITINIDSNLD